MQMCRVQKTQKIQKYTFNKDDIIVKKTKDKQNNVYSYIYK